MLRFSDLSYDNRFIAELPGDKEVSNFCRQVKEAYWSRVQPFSVCAPKLVSVSEDVLAAIGLESQYAKSQEFVDILSGNLQAGAMQPFAMVYGGHQFGHWAGQLGDGRAINLGDVIHEGSRYALQLKGAGPTPYSRNADGFAVLRSSIREFLCSEAMYSLGVPTTRALSLVETGEGIVRDMFYDGHVRKEPGAIVCRVAPSFIRFGHFQLPAARNNFPLLKELIDYCIRVDFPHLGEVNKESIEAWFLEVCKKTAVMIAHWMRVGFVHGVMNTDNMSILGLTIDYGPYGWLEDYDTGWTPNTTDREFKRYAYGNQPSVAQWNLTQLANAIVNITEDVSPLQDALAAFRAEYDSQWRSMKLAKLGISPQDKPSDEESLLADGFTWMTNNNIDMTIFFRRLNQINRSPEISDNERILPLLDACYQADLLDNDQRILLANWLKRLTRHWQIVRGHLPLKTSYPVNLYFVVKCIVLY